MPGQPVSRSKWSFSISFQSYERHSSLYWGFRSYSRVKMVFKSGSIQDRSIQKVTFGPYRSILDPNRSTLNQRRFSIKIKDFKEDSHRVRIDPGSIHSILVLNRLNFKKTPDQISKKNSRSFRSDSARKYFAPRSYILRAALNFAL